MDITQLTALTKSLTDEQKILFTELYNGRKKSTFVAYILLISFGAVGAHKFYLNNGKGWLYLAFFWTSIPSIIAFIELFTLKKQVIVYNQKIATQIIGLMKTYNDPAVAKKTIPTLIKGNSFAGIIAGIFLVIIVIAVFSAMNKASRDSSPHVAVSGSKTSETQKMINDKPSQNNTTYEPTNEKFIDTPQITITAPELYKEYEINEARADNKYKDVLLAVQGQISEIHKYTSSITTVSLGVSDEYGLGSIDCDISSENEILQKVSNGEVVTIIGKVNGNGLTGNAVNLEDGCYIVQNS